MPTAPWQTVIEPVDGQEYTAMLTYLPLKHFWDTPRLMLYIARILRQMRTTPGLAGFTLKAHPWSKDYWTLSVWESDAAINTYVQTPPHSHIMRKMAGAMDQTAFHSWKVRSAQLPLTWDDALGRLKSKQ